MDSIVKNVNISKVANLTIVIDKIKYKIVFNNEDLFTENNGYLYFNVLFTQDNDIFKNDFILGKPFLRNILLFLILIVEEKKSDFIIIYFLKRKKGSKMIIMEIIKGTN